MSGCFRSTMNTVSPSSGSFDSTNNHVQKPLTRAPWFESEKEVALQQRVVERAPSGTLDSCTLQQHLARLTFSVGATVVGAINKLHHQLIETLIAAVVGLSVCGLGNHHTQLLTP
uniref:Uncharacterized protein n=1 Tax=Anopheles merus TaxID=30066 RepID=A0A182V6R9_ANOME